MKQSSAFSRRRFLKSASLALPLSAMSSNGLAAEPASQVAGAVERQRGYWHKNTRLAISMWDFSWLHASHAGGAYEDLERRVAEAKERGYNTLRVDCFPSRVLEPESRFEKNWEPGVDLPRWGATRGYIHVQCAPESGAIGRVLPQTWPLAGVGLLGQRPHVRRRPG